MRKKKKAYIAKYGWGTTNGGFKYNYRTKGFYFCASRVLVQYTRGSINYKNMDVQTFIKKYKPNPKYLGTYKP